MPITPTYPGVYIEEVSSGVHTIAGVATSITAFVGRALRGPTDDPVRVQSFAEFERTFGGLWVDSTLSYAVQQYFQNGGTDAVVVRVARNAAKASFTLTPESGPDPLILEAASPGAWGTNLHVWVDHDIDPSATPAGKVFNLFVKEVDPATNVQTASETFRNVSVDPSAARYVGLVLAQESSLLDVPDPYAGTFPLARPAAIAAATPLAPAVSGSDGDALLPASYQGSESAKTGIYALVKTDLFNLMCLPPPTRAGDMDTTTLGQALTLCANRRAMLIVDPRSAWTHPSDVTNSGTGVDSLGLNGNKKNGAIYFPRVRMADPLKENRLDDFVPCGVVAGIFARTDAQRGVWKAPAGQDAGLSGVLGLSYKLTDGENGQLNPIGVNCLRALPAIGNVVWGARTLEGADRLSSEWKYVPIRRLALYIEESLFRGTQWVVFEPNDEPLWAQIRLNVGAFMHDLFRQGAFQGSSPRDAYFVKCDSDTTTQSDRNLGIVNILVGFAPLKPAEFVIIKLQQIAGQIQA